MSPVLSTASLWEMAIKVGLGRPFHHRDPFDRLIIARAFVERLRVVGRDESFDSYGVQRIW